ncbi:CMRF35-like molecule 9 isoform X1 [Saccopteryx bilineata]|uniref:CMRF35-like molecule 9 isoform X1 n=1 Tax=Saccopteryx bilineata TaxID=59482 RepID=UPI003390709B
MRLLVLLWGCFLLPGYGAVTGPKEISGFEGDTVSLQCSYEEDLRNHKKYWCKEGGIFISRCSHTVYAGEDGQENTEGRVSIQDSPKELRFNVTLRNLTPQDSGKYWCGVKKLGLDDTFLVSLTVLPGPCCLPSSTSSFQPLTTGLQPKAKARQTQPPELTSPGVRPTVTTAKQEKTEAKASPFTGTALYVHAGASPYAGHSPHAVTVPYEETSAHKATSPHAGTSRPSTRLDSTSAKDTSLVPSSSSSKSRVSPPTIRILAPVLVLLALLLATGLAVLGRCMFRRRKEAQLTTETQKNEKAHLSQLPLGNGLVPEYAMINLAAPTGPRASPKPSASSSTDVRCLSQAPEEEEAPFQDPEGEASPGPPPHMSAEELSLSTFISV